MHILFSVHFNSPRGGLHENVFSTVKHSLKCGCKTTVICRDGEFANRLIDIGSKVVTTDFSSIEETAEKVISNDTSFNVIHTHPGPSRKVALQIAEKLNIPIVMTFHGMWIDSLPRYAKDLSAIFPVSEGVKDFLKTKLDDSYNDKFIVMPNGVDKSIYRPKKWNALKRKNKLNISLITRLDKDKDFIIQIFYKALKFTYENYLDKVKWTIVGSGSEMELMKQTTTNITKNKQEVNFVGWKTGKKLLKYYQNSDIIIAPGRSALEAMSCGKPVIAIGSKKYIGLISKENWTEGMYTNFGGFGKKMEDYLEGSIENELKKVIENEKLRNELGNLGIILTNQYYNEEEINNRITGVYKIIKKS